MVDGSLREQLHYWRSDQWIVQVLVSRVRMERECARAARRAEVKAYDRALQEAAQQRRGEQARKSEAHLRRRVEKEQLLIQARKQIEEKHSALDAAAVSPSDGGAGVL